MLNHKTIAGLDVHLGQTQTAALDLATGEVRFRRVNGPSRGVVDYLEKLPAPLQAVYEAGPIGYGLARAAAERGVDLRVCAPGSIPRAPADRVKTDRRDAERLARQLLAGELSFVRVPSVEEEQFRDLARCREAARGDLTRARHRLGKFLLRRELYFPGDGSNWTQAHQKWLRSLVFDDRASRVVFDDYHAAVLALEQRRSALDQAIEECWPESPWADTIARLLCLRGVATITAFGLCSEIGNFPRFEHPAALSSFLGIVPSEHSSGETRKLGPITKTGSPHARRLLVEAAHHYRHQPAISATLERRQRGADPRACQIAWRCQQRLHRQWQRLRYQRGKPANVAVIALARELTEFVWEIGQLTQTNPPTPPTTPPALSGRHGNTQGPAPSRPNGPALRPRATSTRAGRARSQNAGHATNQRS